MKVVQDTIAVGSPVLALRVDLEAFTEACHELNRCRHCLSFYGTQTVRSLWATSYNDKGSSGMAEFKDTIRMRRSRERTRGTGF